ncbi:MAG TPA: nucleoside-diphosphate sugar epimerase, partial [Ramlibacter sp.]
SRIFYNRVKGELEEAVDRLGYEGLVIARPSMLAGDRASLGQPARAGEKLALQASRWLGPLIPRDYRTIQAADVARALLRTVPTARGAQLLLSGQMQP